MQKSELKNMIRQIVSEINLEITLTTSSVKVWPNAKGETMWEVKVYNPDPIAGANKANYLNAREKAIHRGVPFVAPDLIPYQDPANQDSCMNQTSSEFEQEDFEPSPDGPERSPAAVKKEAVESDDDDDLFNE